MGLSLSVEICIVSRWGIVTQSRAAMTAGEVARADATWIAVGLALSWIGSHTQVHSIISTPGFHTQRKCQVVRFLEAQGATMTEKETGHAMTRDKCLQIVPAVRDKDRKAKAAAQCTELKLFKFLSLLPAECLLKVRACFGCRKGKEVAKERGRLGA